MKFLKNGLKIFWSCHHFNLWNVSEIFHPIQTFQKKNSPVNPLNLFFSSIIILLIIAFNHNSHISSIRSHIRCHKSLTWHTRHEKTIYRSSVSECKSEREREEVWCCYVLLTDIDFTLLLRQHYYLHYSAIKKYILSYTLTMLCELSYHTKNSKKEMKKKKEKLQIKSILCRSHKAISRK